ncbi:MAG: enoyl-CoA hydratase-related protein [Bacteroidota bacterium]
MSNLQDNTPIIIGVGQVTEAVLEDLSTASSHADLAGKAAKLALKEAKGASLAAKIDVIAGIKTFADSSPQHQAKTGRTNNFPRSIANRIGANPTQAIYASVGGDSPQKLVTEFAQRLARGACKMVLLAGGEAIANAKAIKRQKIPVNWNENVEGTLEDRGLDGYRLITSSEIANQIILPMQFYALMENARRAALGKTAESYAEEMGQTFSRLSEVAANNPYAVDQTAYDAQTLITPTKENGLIIAPYTKKLIAKDRVNQGAAVLMTTVGQAKKLGITEKKWVFLHGSADTKDTVLLERQHLGQSAGMEQALLGALANADKTAEDIQHFDIYSCFPIVVNEAKCVLNILKDDPRQLTQTGGLPFFGGPGNNYSMHAIASLVENLRKDRGSFGLVYANGGWMSKHAVGVYSTTPIEGDWEPSDSQPFQAKVDAIPKMKTNRQPTGEAILETYTIHYFKGFPVKAIVIGRLKETNERFYATTQMVETETVQALAQKDLIGSTIFVEADPRGNRFAFDKATLAKYRPKVIDTFQDKYKFCTVERNEWVLKVTINRPEVRNALHPTANEELAGIFNAYEKDESLRVAILTGAGNESFSAGNDLKYMASGNPMYIPEMGFAGITSRPKRLKPIIAAVNGLALGGGLEIALACDIIVAADHAKFGLPEVKIGLFAGAGGVQRLPRQIGKKAAMEMMLTGQSIDCDKALALGLINYAVPADQLMVKAEALAHTITQASPMAIRSTLKLFNETAEYASEDAAVAAPHDVFDDLLNSDDFWEGARAFAEKRPPKWTIKARE